MTTAPRAAAVDRPPAPRRAADASPSASWRRSATPSPSSSAPCRSASSCSPATPCRRRSSCRSSAPPAATLAPRPAGLAADRRCARCCTSSPSAPSSRRCASCRWPTPWRSASCMPFILLLLGRFVLGEEVGPHRLAACAVGFVGTLMVVQPSFAAVGAPALLPLLVAVLFSLFMLVTRRIARDADPVVLQAASGLVATAILAPARPPRRRPRLARARPGRRSPAPTGVLLALLGAPRHRRAPRHDLVAALRALEHARADAVPRDPLRHPDRLAGLRRPARTASPPSASPSPSPPASTSSTASGGFLQRPWISICNSRRGARADYTTRVRRPPTLLARTRHPPERRAAARPRGAAKAAARGAGGRCPASGAGRDSAAGNSLLRVSCSGACAQGEGQGQADLVR